jgi:hypothetical protein
MPGGARLDKDLTLAHTADRSVCSSQCCPLTDERLLRAHDAEVVSLWVGKDSPGLGASLPDVDPAHPERKKAVNLLIAVRGAAGEVEVHAVLDRLGSVTGMKHMPTGAFSSVPMTISFSRSDRTFQPSACVQNRAMPGRS